MTENIFDHYVDNDDIEKRAADALSIIADYGHLTGEDRKNWVLEQVIKMLTGKNYKEFVEWQKSLDKFDPKVNEALVDAARKFGREQTQ